MTTEPSPTEPPFQEGDIVSIKDNSHLGYFCVDSCEWYTRSAKPYWYVSATEIRDPVDWSKIPKGATGIVVGSGWAGSSDYCELIERPDEPANELVRDGCQFGMGA